MEKNEVIEKLKDIDDAIREDIFADNTWEQDCELREAIKHAIKCLEMMPELVGCIAMAQDTCDACQYPNLAKEYERVINKAKELIV